MQFPQNTARRARIKVSSNTGGIAGWLLDLLRGARREHQSTIRHMRLLETLPLGGKRQLMLVSCGAERFLVAGGVESIETIVPIQGSVSLNVVAKKLDSPCL
jgi:flagellar biogenesis protein FliO